jgi:hypothetical protein
MAAACMTAAVEAGEGVLSAAIVAGVIDNGAAAVTRFVCMEMVEGGFAMARERTVVSVVRIETIVDVSVETMRAVEPRSGADEESADKPVRSVVAIGSAIVRCVIKVPIGAHGRDSNADRDLGRTHRRTAEQRDGED